MAVIHLDGFAPDNKAYIKNLKFIGHHDIGKENFFQMALWKTGEKYYLYGVMYASMGCGIFDVTDPENPIYIKRFNPVDPEKHDRTKTCKVQVCDGLLMVALSSGAGPWFSARGSGPPKNPLCGIQIYDIKEDPENPRLLSFWDNGTGGGNGVHRFTYDGGRYAHLSSDCIGYYGMIYRIIDIEDPTNPKEAGRWWLNEQYLDGQLGVEFDLVAPYLPDFLDHASMHGPAFIRDGLAYIGYMGGGFVIVDVHDVSRPRLVGRLQLKPPFSGGRSGARCHTAMPLPGRDFAVVTTEGTRFRTMTPEQFGGHIQPFNSILMVDIKNPAEPTLVGLFPYPEVPEEYPFDDFNDCGIGAPGPFGPHNIHEPMENKPYLDRNPNRVYCCYFHAGLRVYDVSNPYNVKEIAYFIPPTPEWNSYPHWPGPMLPTTEDLIVDDRGNIIINSLDGGLFILRVDEQACV